MSCPRIAIGQPTSLAQQFVGLHIAGMIGRLVPERAYLWLVVLLPVVVHFGNYLHGGERLGLHLLLAFGICSKADGQCYKQ